MKKQFAILAAGVTLLAVPALSKPAVAPKPAPNKVAANETPEIFPARTVMVPTAAL